MILFITNRCTHYNKGFFEKLTSRAPVKFVFDNKLKEPNNPLILDQLGNFNYRYLKSIKVGKVIIPCDLSLIKEIKKAKIIVKSDENQMSILISFILAKFFQKKYIVWYSLWNEQKSKGWIVKRFIHLIVLNGCDAIVCYGSHVYNYLLKNYKINENKLYLEHHATYYFNNPKREIILSGADVKVLFVGRLAEEKGILWLIESIKNCTSNFKLLIIGNGPLEAVIKDKIRHYRLNNKIEMVGFISPSEIGEMYLKADVLVLPSITTKQIKETWGLVVNEAMNYGLPVIVSDAVGAAAGGLVENNINGIIVSENNIEQLTKALDMLVNEEKLRETYGMNGQNKIKSWSYEKMTSDFLHAINSVM